GGKRAAEAELQRRLRARRGEQMQQTDNADTRGLPRQRRQRQQHDQPEERQRVAHAEAESRQYTMTFRESHHDTSSGTGISASRLRTRSDLVEHATVGKELRLRLAPVAEQLRDGESLHRRKLAGVFLRHLREARTIEMARLD